MINLNEVLMDLRKYGIVTVHSYDDGTWSFNCDIIGTRGAETRVRSERKHKDPTDAAHQCQERVAEYIMSIKS